MTKNIKLASAVCAAAMAAVAQDAAPAEEPTDSFPLLAAAKELNLSATLEVTAAWTKQGDEKDSDVNLDTAEIDIGGNINDRLSVALAILYEEGEDVCFDVAEFEYSFESVEGLTLHGGQLYMPFGVFETALISDPLTLELGEISDAALGLKWSNDFVEVGAYAFGGDINDETDDAEEMNWSAFAALTPFDGLRLSAAVLSDIGEAGMQDDIIDAVKNGVVDEETGDVVAEGSYDGAVGLNFAAVAEFDAFTVAAEWVGAAEDMELNGEKSKPQAWAIDVAWAVCDAWTLGARYEGSKEFRVEEMPETQFAVGAEWAFDDNIALALEYAWGRFEKIDGERPDDRHALTTRVAVEF